MPSEIKTKNGSFTVPAYRRIQEDLRARIRNGHWPAGAMLPSRKSLAEEYGVNLETVQRGIQALLKDGVLTADNGRGTFVSRTIEPEAAQPTTAQERRVEGISALASGSEQRAKTIMVAVVGQYEVFHQGHVKALATLAAIESVERSLAAAGCVTRFFPWNQGTERCASLEDALGLVSGNGIDGVVVVNDYLPVDSTQSTRSFPVPCVLISCEESRSLVPHVYYDHRDAGQVAARHLLDNGCQTLHFFSPFQPSWALSRLEGAREAVILAGLSSDALRPLLSDHDVLNIRDGLHMTVAYEEAKRILSRSSLPLDGVIGSNDYVALGFAKAAAEFGLIAGRDYALIGFDDRIEARLENLTTLRPSLAAMGQEAARLIIAAIGGQELQTKVCMHSDLIVRGSSSINK